MSYLAASLVAGSILFLWLSLTISIHSGKLFLFPVSYDLKGLLIVIAVSSELAAVLGLLPALPTIIYSEQRGIRSFWFHAYGGALIGLGAYLQYLMVLALPDLAQVFDLLENSFAFPGYGMWLATALSGFCGGAMYWILVGRNKVVRRADLPDNSVAALSHE
ncbi:hypothetical protein [Bradyrhizobium sp. STM 3557]|uniref:hypothetical protein n=1 Tax=Bradyrhizobium sp. STM 3557 TaxID=578920 RepID=UPI00388F74E8